MRSRNIKPGFFKNDCLAECDPLARILFAGLWCMADRAGRLEYRMKKIKAEILPYDTCNIGKLIGQLAEREFITVYDADGNTYIEINNFQKHQNPHHRETESTIPAPDKPEAGPGLAQGKPRTSPIPARLIPDSLNLIPDSTTPPNPPTGGNGDGGFDAFWTAYPKKRGGKDRAREAWNKARDRPPTDRILEAIDRQKRSVQWLREDGQFIPYPAKWLKDKRWEDEVESPPATRTATW